MELCIYSLKHFRNVVCGFSARVFCQMGLLFCSCFMVLHPAYAADAHLAEASGQPKIVHVGFFRYDGYHSINSEGEKSGYGYEFLQMISGYANFKYIYVGYQKTWHDMLTMLEDGTIDLLTHVQKNPGYEDRFAFSKYSMGTTSSLLTTSASSKAFANRKYVPFNGMRVGMIEGSDCIADMAAYAKAKNLSYTPVSYSTFRSLQEALAKGEDIDAMVSCDLRVMGREIILDKLATHNVYAMVRKDNTGLLRVIDEAIRGLSTANPNWEAKLRNKYCLSGDMTGFSTSLSDAAFVKHLAEAGGKLKVLFNPARYPLAYTKQGKATGVLVDIFKKMAASSGLPYEFLDAGSVDRYYELRNSGAADIVMDFEDSMDKAEQLGYRLTSPYASSAYASLAVNDFSGKTRSTAVLTGSRLFRKLAETTYPRTRLVYCDTVRQCVDAVISGKVDCALTYALAARLAAMEESDSDLVATQLGNLSSQFRFAVNAKADIRLYGLLNNLANTVNSSETQEVFDSYFSHAKRHVTLWSYLKDNPGLFFIFFSIVTACVFCFAFVQKRNASLLRASNTALELSQNTLKEAFSAAEHANAAKTTFLSSMSHDIRTPMNAIIGETAIAQAYLDDKIRVEDCLRKITSSGKQLLEIINEVLDMSRIESGKAELVEEEVNLADLVDSVIASNRPACDAKKQTLDVGVREVEHENVIGDSSKLSKLCNNFLSNAIKYTPTGGHIGFLISERKTQSRHLGCYEFVFTDDGIGMSQEFQEHVFEPFVRSSEVVGKEQGTGLGLAIAKSIVQMMNGNIELESKPQKGTRIKATLYLALQEEPDYRCEDFVNLPVLVVDDQQPDCESACLLLERIGMNPEGIFSGREAVVKTTRRHEEGNDYFAVLLDWKMPGMDGVETARAIRDAVGKDVPIIVLSAYEWTEIEQEARSAGVNDFISKPIFKSRLIALFSRLAGREVHSEGASNGLEEMETLKFTGKRILLAEDNDINAEIVSEFLHLAGITVDWVKNGQLAVEKVAKSVPGYYALVFMDVQMPVMNGLEATKAIRLLEHADAKSLPIVAMTANAFASDVHASFAAGMNGHISKPIDIKVLLRVLKSHLEGCEAPLPAGGNGETT